MATLETIETILKEFKKNTENHLEKLNSKVAKHEQFIQSKKDEIQCLIDDRNNTIKRYTDLIFKIGVAVMALILGMQKFL